ncbi:MAG: BTAD domain-containing putative transcriptional regulator, partial [Meiothermus sp.]|nr:BTAD domain-containing putative transcriptional regulator [Meiothermus sp.]
MLAYLAVHDRWVGRDELARLLWPDADPEAAKGNLRQLLYRTRQSGWAPALEVERTQLRWREGSDLHLFRRAYRDKQWLEAVEIYQGELLTGFEAFGAEEFSAWLEIERRDLNALWREAAQNQVAVFEQAGRFGEAAGLLERILRSDPLAEDVLCEHLRLAASSGRRDRALELYQSFAKQLDNELGLEPRAETRKRFEELRSVETQKPKPAPQAPASEPAPSAHRLPLPQTRFVGRNTEMEWLEDKLNIPGAQVLCLVGPGGIGKTHLALEAARRFPGQAVFVSLVGHDAGQSLAPAVAQAVGLMLSGKAEAEAELAAMLEGHSVLLVLDNVEQVVEEARRLAAHLQGLEGVQLLFTSRVRLGLAAEHTLELGGLSFPQRGESTGTADESYAAIRLLLETVGRVNPQGARAPEDQAEAARICQTVAGVPLALVLAGSWARMLSLGEIADELEKSLDFLGGAVRGLPERHQSIRNVFEYSWRLLSEEQRLALAALSVFR